MTFKKNIFVKTRNIIRDSVVSLNLFILRTIFGINIGEGTVISLKAQLDKTNPKGLKIGKYCYVAADAMLLSHDYINRRHVSTQVGNNVFIGAKSIILPGVVIVDNVVVAAGSIVNKSILESNVIVAGNPAIIVRRNVKIGKHGRKQVNE
ncbi:acyltransferase [Alteromonas facilis]|uniref:acyltransferase n=1 Tax=Alteromonas facilis TaxID=2048004 RepID=UPI000C28D8E6|nr:DapH/DapD/GlmU-related protein [Alteromonas facilis]